MFWSRSWQESYSVWTSWASVPGWVSTICTASCLCCFRLYVVNTFPRYLWLSIGAWPFQNWDPTIPLSCSIARLLQQVFLISWLFCCHIIIHAEVLSPNCMAWHWPKRTDDLCLGKLLLCGSLMLCCLVLRWALQCCYSWRNNLCDNFFFILSESWSGWKFWRVARQNDNADWQPCPID